ncbi:MAG: hypothetical protein ACYC1U_09395 [Candidatus Aquicultorales bacterium]
MNRRFSTLSVLMTVLALGFIFAATLALSPSVVTVLLGGASIVAALDLINMRLDKRP